MVSRKSAKSQSRRSPKSLTLEPQLLEALVDIKGKLIQKTHQDFSISTLVNLLAIAGILSSHKLTASEWGTIKSMIKEKRIRVSGKTIQNCVLKLAN